VSSSFDLPEVDRFVCGNVGSPGQRIFYIQAVSAGQLVSLRVEKQQVDVLCDYLERVLATHELPESPPTHMAELVEPGTDERVVGSIMVAINEAAGRVVIIAEELTDDETEASSARFGLTGSQVDAFVDGARRIVAGGRPTCRLCGRPMDPDGHPCPRMN